MFPIYDFDVPPFHNSTGEPGMAIMHQRMGWYVAPNGRLLVRGFYGWTNPFGPGGIGRVVREIYKDGTYGPIYFIKYNPHFRSRDMRARRQTEDPGWNEENTKNPFTPGKAPMPVLYYKHSPDRASWSLRSVAGGPAEDDAVVGGGGRPATLFKGRRRPGKARLGGPFGISPEGWRRRFGMEVRARPFTDEGKTWSNVVAVPSIITAGAKVWGQKTTDGRYALVYNPANRDGYHRWPLAIVTSDDGITFDHMLWSRATSIRAATWAAPRTSVSNTSAASRKERNSSRHRHVADLQHQGGHLGRPRSRARSRLGAGSVADNFDDMAVGGDIKDWNIQQGYGRGGHCGFPERREQEPATRDRDPYNYAKAERVFSPGRLEVYFRGRVYAHQRSTGQLNVEVLNHTGTGRCGSFRCGRPYLGD